MASSVCRGSLQRMPEVGKGVLGAPMSSWSRMNHCEGVTGWLLLECLLRRWGRPQSAGDHRAPRFHSGLHRLSARLILTRRVRRSWLFSSLLVFFSEKQSRGKQKKEKGKGGACSGQQRALSDVVTPSHFTYAFRTWKQQRRQKSLSHPTGI